MSVVRKTLLVVSLMASGAAYAGTPGWSVSEASGPVFVAKPGLSKTSVLARGATLAVGDIVSTGKGGRAVIVRGGEYLTVAPNTQLQLTEPKAGAFTQIVQAFGNVVFKIQKKTTPHFQVNTPYLAAVVKGTTFSVTVTPAGASVQVTEGLVQVASLDGLASRFVSPGEIGMISAAAPGQLSVLGSPNAPSGGAVVIGAAPAADAQTGETPPEPAAAPASDFAEVRIASPIGEGNVNLAAQTGGIVSGNSSLTQAAIVEAVAVETPVQATGEARVALAETPPPPAPPVAPEVEAPVLVAVATPPSQPETPSLSDVAAPPPVEVAVIVPTPVEPVAPPVEVAFASPVAPVAPEVEAPVLVAVTTPPSQPDTPALSDVAAPPPVEVAVIVSPPVEPVAPPVEVAVAAPIAPAAPVAETPVLVAANPAPNPAAIAVNNANPNSAVSNPSNVGTPGSNDGNGQSNGASGNRANGGNSSNSGTGSNGGNSSNANGTAVAGNASGGRSNSNPMTLSELLQRLRVAAQQVAANRRGN